MNPSSNNHLFIKYMIDDVQKIKFKIATLKDWLSRPATSEAFENKKTTAQVLVLRGLWRYQLHVLESRLKNYQCDLLTSVQDCETMESCQKQDIPEKNPKEI